MFMTLYRFLAPLVAVLLLAACAAAPTPTPTALPPGSFSAEISGDVNVTMPPGEARYAYVDEVDIDTFIPAHNELLFFQFSDDKLYQVSIEFGLEAQPGTYPFEGAEVSEDISVAAMFSDYETGGEVIERDLIDYSENVTGTLTIDEIGATISGSYEFTAETTTADGETRQITARGTFEDIPYQAQS